jgi:hypothetical protein
MLDWSGRVDDLCQSLASEYRIDNRQAKEILLSALIPGRRICPSPPAFAVQAAPFRAVHATLKTPQEYYDRHAGPVPRPYAPSSAPYEPASGRDYADARGYPHRSPSPLITPSKSSSTLLTLGGSRLAKKLELSTTE